MRIHPHVTPTSGDLTYVDTDITESHCLSPSAQTPRRNNGNSIRSNRHWKTSSTSLNASLSLTPTTIRLHIDPTHLPPPGSLSAVLILASAAPFSVSGTRRPSMLHGPLQPLSRLKSTCRATGKRRNVLFLVTAPMTGSRSRNTSTMCSSTVTVSRS